LALTEPTDLTTVFERAILARVSSFDLIGDDGMKALCEEIPADFPYLTLADLNATIKLGIKGKLDTYKNRPLNFTRVYQWVEQRAPYSLGYWHAKYPELMAWAETTGVAAEYVNELVKTTDANGVVIPVFSSAKTTLRSLVGNTYYPNLYTGLTTNDEDGYLQQQANRHRVETVLWAAFCEAHPDFAAKHPNLF
jgi:hypothetical protein